MFPVEGYVFLYEYHLAQGELHVLDMIAPVATGVNPSGCTGTGTASFSSLPCGPIPDPIFCQITWH